MGNKWSKNWLTSSNSQRKAEMDLHGSSAIPKFPSNPTGVVIVCGTGGEE